MVYAKSALVLWQDEGEECPSDILPPYFVVKGKNKLEVLEKLINHFEYCAAIMRHDGKEGIDYRKIANIEAAKHKLHNNIPEKLSKQIS